MLTRTDALAFLAMANGMRNILQAYTPEPVYRPIPEERFADLWESHRRLLNTLFVSADQSASFVSLIRAISGDEQAEDNPRTRQNLALTVSRLPNWVKDYGCVQSVRAVGYRWVEKRA